MSKIVYNPVHNKKLQLLPASGESSYLVDTKANILATTPTAGNAGFASDTLEMFIGNGTVWRKAVLPLGKTEQTPSMGALPYFQDYGYGQGDITNKRLHSIIVAPYDTAQKASEGGSLSFDFTTKTFLGYLDGEWKTFSLFGIQELSDLMRFSDYSVNDTKDIYGNDRLHDGKMDIGAIASEKLINGGTF